ncbi:MAG: PAS domain-containing protein [Elusimicrobia bacterium]|nr:PAS domain-containing protein [Elusimicrobiota bacterium]
MAPAASLGILAGAAVVLGACGYLRFKGILKRTQAELLQERTKLETLIRNIPEALVLSNLRGDILYMNPAAQEVLGVRPEIGQGKLSGEWARTVEIRQQIQRILENHTRVEVVELQVPRAGGNVLRHYRTLVTLFSVPDMLEMSVMLLLRDITDERQLDSLKTEFFQAVAHDLRAPLFAMQGYLRLLEKSVGPDKHQQGYFDAINQSCEKLTLFIQDTLDSARIESGQLKLAVSPMNPQLMVSRAMNLFRPLAHEKGIRLETQAGMDAPDSVDVDERLMERVFYNLLSNALKFTPRGGAITVHTRRVGPGTAEFCVADTGLGLPPEVKSRIFEKFCPRPQGQTVSGFGLGLHICHKIVQVHKGRIWADSEPGRGSQFIIQIPVKHLA